MDLTELYRDVIVDHNKSPRNFRVLEQATVHADGHNPLCGDKLTLYIKLNGGGVIEDVSFQGNGCAISVASASLMTELVKGKTEAEAAALFEKFHALVTEDGEVSEVPDKLAVLTGVRQYPARVKCATLSWHTLHAALTKQKYATTE